MRRPSRSSRGLWPVWVAAICAGSVALGVAYRSAPATVAQSAGGDGARSSAEPLGIYAPIDVDDYNEQTRLVLEADARRREARFRDAVEPGFLFKKTRVEQAEIDAGDIKPSALYQLGAQLFNYTFTPRDGFGAKDLPPIARFQKGKRGGPDAHSCSNCHWRGGPAGAGDAADNAYLDGDGDTQDSAFARNPRPLVGAGVIELIAREMTAEIALRKQELIRQARAQGKALRTTLSAKGILFGKLGALPDGALDTSALEGISPDLIVRPFGWKGTSAGIREAVEDELLLHHGMQSDFLVRSADLARIGSFSKEDPDGDGVTQEINEGQVTAMTVFLVSQEIPTIELPLRQDQLAYYTRGKQLFDELGCAGCHTPSVELDSAIYELPSRAGGPPLRVDIGLEGAAPRLQRGPTGKYQAWLYSDLKRHDMGPELAEPRPDRGIEGRFFSTPPLWGLARSRPYLHDGRAATSEEAILAHGGEALQSRDAFSKLEDRDRYPLRLFLSTLTRKPKMVAP